MSMAGHFVRSFADRESVRRLISVSISGYRALLLGWALWLARRVLRWLPWAAQQLCAGNLWKCREPKKPATPPPLPK